MKQHLTVGLTPKANPPLEPLPQLPVVVDLAVRREDDVPVLADERLPPALGVDQREPREGHARLPGVVELHVVRPARPQRMGHVAENRVGRPREGASVGVGESCNSAHMASDSPVTW